MSFFALFLRARGRSGFAPILNGCKTIYPEKEGVTPMKKVGLLYGMMALATTALLATGCVAEGGEIDEGVVAQSSTSWEQFLDVVYQEPDTGIYIVNGDEPVVGLEALELWYVEHVQRGALAVMTSGGSDVKWDSTKALNITYCISKSGFGANYNAVVSAMNT